MPEQCVWAAIPNTNDLLGVPMHQSPRLTSYTDQRTMLFLGFKNWTLVFRSWRNSYEENLCSESFHFLVYVSACFSCSYFRSLNALLTLHFPCFPQAWVAAACLVLLASMGPWSFPVHPSALSLAYSGSNPSGCALPACSLPAVGSITFKMEIITLWLLLHLCFTKNYEKKEANLKWLWSEPSKILNILY